jgi:conjugal transfer pilus assembly protein TraK
LSGRSWALQQVDAVEGRTIFVKMSLRDFNRIAIEGGRIRLIKGADSRLVVGDKDEVTGQALVKPLVKDPFSLFVFSENRAYTLVVQPSDIPAENIILKEQALAQSIKPVARIEKSGSYEKSIKSMLQIMAGDSPPDGIEVKKTWDEILLWKGTRFAREAVYSGVSLVGEKYRLFNVGSTPIQIAEQEFYKKGVLAVSVQDLSLEPGHSTVVYVIKRNEGVN